MALPRVNHHDWMFFEGPTIGFSGFSMVLDILTEMVNDGIEENNDFPLTN